MKIAILGYSGSGKSTLARKLGGGPPGSTTGTFRPGMGTR